MRAFSVNPAGIYGGSDWSVEAWVWVWAQQAENNILQWGLRGGSVAGEAASMGAGAFNNFTDWAVMQPAWAQVRLSNRHDDFGERGW